MKISESGFGEAGHLFEAHFAAQRGHRVDNNQTAYAFLELTHIGLLFFGDGAAMRHAHQLLRFFAQLLALNLTQANEFRLNGGFLFFQLGVFFCGVDQGQVGLLVVDSVKTIAQTFNLVFFDFFHGGLIY